MLHHIEIPELELTSEQRDELLALHQTHQSNEYHFVPPKGKGVDLGLHMLVDYKRCDLIHRLESRVRFVKQSYFLKNSGVDIHRDMKRTAVIGFELSNPLNVPTDIYSDDKKLVERVFYTRTNAVMWDTTRLHAVDHTPIDRVFFQMELERHLSYQDYVNLYKTKELFRW